MLPEPGEKDTRREERNATRGKLDREWQAIKTVTDFRDCRSIVVRDLEIWLGRLGLLKEEGNRSVLRQFGRRFLASYVRQSEG